MKKLYPYILFLLFLIIFTLLWDKIKLPYNESNLIQGEYYLKKFNPYNEILRFIIFIFIPLFIFLISYLKVNEETFSINPNNSNFFLKKKLIFHNEENIDKITLIFLSILVLEFFFIDFNKNLFLLDVFHEGAHLVPPFNYISSKSYWISSFYDLGLIANNIGLFFFKAANFYTIGSIRFTFLILIFLNKILLILIIRKIVSSLNFKEVIKIIFFVILSLIVLNFANYNLTEISVYSPRAFIFLLFFLFLIIFLTSKKSSLLKPFIIGIFSLISVLWWIDIGIYINLLIFFLFAYLILQKEYKKIYLIIAGILFSWLLFFLFIPSNEIKEFFYQFYFIVSTSDYLLGLEYPTPFSEGSSRATKALILIAISGIFLIIINFKKKIDINYETKIIILFLFLSSIIFFNSSLMRSDTPHIKYTSGNYMIVFYFCVLFFFSTKLKNNKVIIFFNDLLLKKKISFYLIILTLSFFTIIKSNIKNITNIINIKNDINYLLHAKNDVFITNEYKEFYKYFAEISKDDLCVQILSDDIVLPYLLKKPSCTQFFFPSYILTNWNENKFIEQLNKSKPNFILYSSPLMGVTKKENMPNVDFFIKNNYYLFNDFKGRLIYKKK